jgi:predicted glutamine amidotransferase
MCELFAMSARFPTTVRLSLDELARHGGATGPHRDGWGIALLDEGDAVVIREPEAASESRWVEFLNDRLPRTELAIAHVRKATQGARKLRNTQPFSRELGGRLHVFAHNGNLTGLELEARPGAQRFRPIGETDSEVAFCLLLERLAPMWDNGNPSLGDRLRELAAFASEMRQRGPANFLYSDGDVIVAHGHERTQADGRVSAPGLHVLCRSCTAGSDAVPLAGVSIDPEALQEVALVASVPLSGERWEPLVSGEMVVLRHGRVEQHIAP